MEQPRTRIPRPSSTPPRAAADRPPGGRSRDGRPPAGRPAPPAPGRSVTKLTGFGTGVVVTATTLLGAVVNRLFSDDLGAFFGVVFVGASLGGALWVRQADLAAGPVCAPIAFALAVALADGDGGGGVLGHLAATVTGLATLTAWLYAGTLLAAVVVVTRRVGRRRGGRGNGGARRRSSSA